MDLVIQEQERGYTFDVHHYGATAAPVASAGGNYLVEIHAESIEKIKQLAEEHPMLLPQRFALRDLDGSWSLV